jgi:hypothetical protein
MLTCACATVGNTRSAVTTVTAMLVLVIRVPSMAYVSSEFNGPGFVEFVRASGHQERDAHSHTNPAAICRPHPFAEQRNCGDRSYKRGRREIGGLTGRADLAQRIYVENDAQSVADGTHGQ